MSALLLYVSALTCVLLPACSVCKRPDGSDWLLGSGSFGRVVKGLVNGEEVRVAKAVQQLPINARRWLTALLSVLMVCMVTCTRCATSMPSQVDKANAGSTVGPDAASLTPVTTSSPGLGGNQGDDNKRRGGRGPGHG